MQVNECDGCFTLKRAELVDALQTKTGMMLAKARPRAPAAISSLLSNIALEPCTMVPCQPQLRAIVTDATDPRSTMARCGMSWRLPESTLKSNLVVGAPISASRKQQADAASNFVAARVDAIYSVHASVIRTAFIRHNQL